MQLKVLSLFSGIGGFEKALENLGKLINMRLNLIVLFIM